MYVLRHQVFYEPEDKSVAVLKYDDYYRDWHKTFQSITSNAGIARVRPLLEAEVSNLTQALADGRTYQDAVRAWSLAVPLVATTVQRLHYLPKSSADFF